MENENKLNSSMYSSEEEEDETGSDREESRSNEINNLYEQE